MVDALITGGSSGGGTGGSVTVTNFPAEYEARIVGTISVTDAGNSSDTPLSGGASFTGAGIETNGYSSVSFSVSSDVVSAADGVQMQWSADGTNWSTRGTSELTAARVGQTGATDLSQRIHDKYFRIVYTNGSTAQSWFRLQTRFHAHLPMGDTIGVDQIPKSGMDALLTKSIIAGKTTAGGGAYVDVKVNPSGSLTADVSNSANVGVTGPLTDTQLRASAVLVSAASLPLPTGAATETTLVAVHDDIQTELGLIKTNQTNGLQVVKGAVTPTIAGFATPADCQNTVSLLCGWDVAASQWKPVVWESSTADGEAGHNCIAVESYPMVFNGTTWDRQRGNVRGAFVAPAQAASASLSNVSSSASNVTLLAANTNRRGVVIVNDSTAVLYVKFGATASATSYTYRLASNATLEFANPIYAGQVDGIWASANGAARITEMA